MYYNPVISCELKSKREKYKDAKVWFRPIRMSVDDSAKEVYDLLFKGLDPLKVIDDGKDHFFLSKNSPRVFHYNEDNDYTNTFKKCVNVLKDLKTRELIDYYDCKTNQSQYDDYLVETIRSTNRAIVTLENKLKREREWQKDLLINILNRHVGSFMRNKGIKITGQTKGKLSIMWEDVILKDENDILYSPRSVSFRINFMSKTIKAINPSSDPRYAHPHIDPRGSICFGGYGSAIRDYLSKLDLLPVLIWLDNFVRSYYSQDCYYHITEKLGKDKWETCFIRGNYDCKNCKEGDKCRYFKDRFKNCSHGYSLCLANSCGFRDECDYKYIEVNSTEEEFIEEINRIYNSINITMVSALVDKFRTGLILRSGEVVCGDLVLISKDKNGDLYTITTGNSNEKKKTERLFWDNNLPYSELKGKGVDLWFSENYLQIEHYLNAVKEHFGKPFFFGLRRYKRKQNPNEA